MEVHTRRLFTHSMVLALALGVTAFTYAQDSSQSSSTGAGQSTSSTKGQKSSSSSGDMSKGSNSADTSSSSASGSVPAADKAFVTKAAQGGLAEVELGQLAASKGNSDAVKQFGQKMVDDHSKANDELKSLAQQKGITLPTEPKASDKQTKARLEKLSGDAFDKAYMQHMVQDHKKDVAQFKKESTSGKDPDVKAWAGKTLPTLQGHLQTAQSNMAQLGGGSKTAAKKSQSAQQ